MIIILLSLQSICLVISILNTLHRGLEHITFRQSLFLPSHKTYEFAERILFSSSLSQPSFDISCSKSDRYYLIRVGVEGSKVAEWERDTWPELVRLAKEVPEAGIHFQGIRQSNNSGMLVNLSKNMLHIYEREQKTLRP